MDFRCFHEIGFCFEMPVINTGRYYSMDVPLIAKDIVCRCCENLVCVEGGDRYELCGGAPRETKTRSLTLWLVCTTTTQRTPRKVSLPPSPCKTKPCVHIDDASLQTVDFITS